MSGTDTPVPQKARALGSRYTLERPLGSGAMGEVWVAREVASGERVAAKLLRRELTADPVIVGRFVQERAILLDLHHPHIVRVRDLVVEGDDLAIVMDLVQGSDLRRALAAAGRLAPHEAARIVADVLDALAAAHARGILHRDVKPDNVLMTADEPPVAQLSDFSIARLAQETTVRMTGVLGTADYIAPEVFTAEAIGPSADVYGAGVTLYELLAGHPPFAGKGNAYAVAHRHVNALPPPIPGLPPALAGVLADLLAKDPARRPTAERAARELRAAGGALQGLAELPPVPAPTQWAPVVPGTSADAGGGQVAVRGYAPDQDALDPGRTSIRALPGRDGPGPAAGPVAGDPLAVALPGQASTAADPTATQISAPRPRRDRDGSRLLGDEREAEPGGRRRRTVLLGAAAAVAVAAVVAGVLALVGTGAHGHRRAAPAQRGGTAEGVGATLPGSPLPTGLSVLREGRYDPAEHLLTTTLTYSSATADLDGPLFESVPAAAAGAPCPDAVGWSGVVAARDTTPGVDVDACGWQLAVDSIAHGESVTASYTVDFTPPPGTDAQRAVQNYLRKASTATVDALSHLAGSPVYPVQRLTDVSVRVEGVVHVARTIRVVVLPVWAGDDGNPDNLDPLYTWSDPAPTALDRMLGGAVSLTSESCGGNIGFAGHVPYARNASENCTITARLGGVSAESPSFDIGNNSGG